MDKKLFILLIACLSVWEAQAQGRKSERGTYLNLGYAAQQLKNTETNLLVTSKWAASFTIGHTYLLHKEPLLDLIRFGIDVTFFDLNVADYSGSYQKKYGYPDESAMFYQVEAGMHVGPSITFYPPVDKLKANLYFRYAPSASAFYSEGEDITGYNYAGFLVSGLAVSYKAISMGMEVRWNTASYKILDESYQEKWETKATRYYISFRY
jgi:hypothetical protein